MNLPPPDRAGLRHHALRVLRIIGVDRSIAIVAAGRGWALIASPITLYLIATRFSLEVQGYYYTFANVLSIGIFFELGLGYVISTFAGHEAAHLAWSARGTLEGDATAKARLGHLLRMAVKWYGVTAAAMCLVLIVGGTYFFAARPEGGVDWRGPWLLVATTTSLASLLVPFFALLEGCGKVAEIGTVRLAQQAGGNALLWTVLLLGGQLYASPVVSAFSVVLGAAWLLRTKLSALRDLFSLTGPHSLSWSQDVWPVQWRVAVSWISGWFIYQLFNPILFQFHGAPAAGRMGMSLTLAQALTPLSAAWITTKTPRMAGLVAKRSFVELDALFFRALWQSLGIVVLGGLLILGVVVTLHAVDHPLALRVLAPGPFAALVAVAVANHVMMSESLYLRAHKQEAFMPVSLTLGVCMAVGGYLAGRFVGPDGLAYTYLALTSIVGVGLGTAVFRARRRAWHAEPG